MCYITITYNSLNPGRFLYEFRKGWASLNMQSYEDTAKIKKGVNNKQDTDGLEEG